MQSIPCAKRDCDEAIFGFAAARQAPNGYWLCPEHRP